MLVEHDLVNLEQCRPSFGVSINYYALLNIQNLTLIYICMAETQLSTILHLTKRTSVYRCVKCRVQRGRRKAIVGRCRAKSTRDYTKWAYRIFDEWQLARTNKHPRSESCSLMFDLDKVQRMDINITSMTADSLCFWLTKFSEDWRSLQQNGNAIRRELFTVWCVSMYKMLIRMKHYIKNTNEREKLYNSSS